MLCSLLTKFGIKNSNFSGVLHLVSLIYRSFQVSNMLTFTSPLSPCSIFLIFCGVGCVYCVLNLFCSLFVCCLHGREVAMHWLK
jgi:hypothetical protein